MSMGPSPVAADSRNTRVDAAVRAWSRDVERWRVFVDGMSARAELDAIAPQNATVAEHEARVLDVLEQHRHGAASAAEVLTTIALARAVVNAALVVAEGVE